MRRRILLLSIIWGFADIASANAQAIDSAQWPFPDSLPMTPFLSGNYSFEYQGIALDGSQRMIDSGWTIHEFQEVPAYPNASILFTWSDVHSIDSVGWHLGNQMSSVTLAFDSSTHTIDRLEYSYNDFDYSSPHEILSYTLNQLQYDQSSITCSDDDLWRHLQFASYKMILGFTGDLTTVTLSGLDGFRFYGTLLTPGFSFPSKIDFGFNAVNSSHDSAIVLHNVSDTALLIHNYSLKNADSTFSFLDTSLHAIAAEDSGTITFRFHPQEAQVYSDTITITTDEPYAPPYTIQITGTAAASDVALTNASIMALEVTSDMANSQVQFILPFLSGRLSIGNILGNQLYSNVFMPDQNHIVSIDTRSWPNGIYFVSYSNEAGSATAKFIVQH